MAWKLNKGEWTEAYVFCKLLADGRIYAGDENLNKIVSVYMDILKVIRQNRGVQAEYRRGIDFVVASEDGVDFITVSVEEFTRAAEEIHNKAISTTAGERAIAIKEAEAFLKDTLHIQNIKEKCVTDNADDKTDILIEVLNNVDNCKERVGFSIKSHLGSPATLFNYSNASRMVYKIKNCDVKTMHILNAMKNSSGGCDLEARLAYIKGNEDLELEFMGSKIMDNQRYGDTKETGPFFTWNVEHYDANMIEVFSAMLLSSYGYLDVKPQSASLIDVAEALAEINPLRVHNTDTVYASKLKDFFVLCFCRSYGIKKMGWEASYQRRIHRR